MLTGVPAASGSRGSGLLCETDGFICDLACASSLISASISAAVKLACICTLDSVFSWMSLIFKGLPFVRVLRNSHLKALGKPTPATTHSTTTNP